MSQQPIEISCSRNFLTWLDSQKVSLAFTTYQTNRLFLVGIKPDGKLSTFERMFVRAMGLATTTDRMYLATRYQIWRFDNNLRPGEIYRHYDKVYVPHVGYTTGDLDVHDVAVDSSGNLVFVNTLYNCLATLSDSYSFKALWQPKFVSRLAAEDRCHLNGLAMVDGKPGYVTTISQSDMTDGWRDNRNSGGCIIEVDSHEIVTTGLSMPHSPRYYQGKLWVLNSGRGEFGYVDRDTGKFEVVTFCPGYPRGLAFYGDYAVIGISKPRDKTFTGLDLDELLTTKKINPRCGLLVINLRTGDIVHWLWIEGVVTELYDVQILPGVRCAMSLGFKTNEIAQMITFETATRSQKVTFTDSNQTNQETEKVSDNLVTHPSSNVKVPNLAPKHIISFSLCGDDPRYTLGAIKNVELASEIYPGWICRFYVAEDVPQNIINSLSSYSHVEIIRCTEKECNKNYFWRFYAAAEPDIAAVIMRDTDSRLNWREKAAVDAWLSSDKAIHIMRDHPYHTWWMMGGMWGVKGNYLLDIKSKIDDFLVTSTIKEPKYSSDQIFLSNIIYPTVLKDSLIHDEIFEGEKFPSQRVNYEFVGAAFNADGSKLRHPSDEILQNYLSSEQKWQEHLNIAKMLKSYSELECAVFSLRQAIKLNPNFAAAYNNLGTILQTQAKLTEAKQCYEKVLELKPNIAATHSNLATIWQLEGNLTEAKAGFIKALELKPTYTPALTNLANIYQQERNLAEAKNILERVLQQEPNNVSAQSKLASILSEEGYLNRALAIYKSILQQNPESADIYIAIAQIHEFRSELELAAKAYDKALALEPDNKLYRAVYSHTRLKLADWNDYQENLLQITELVKESVDRGKNSPLSPYVLNTYPLENELYLAVAKNYAANLTLSVKAIKDKCNFIHNRKPQEKIKIGYISADFRTHVVGRLIQNLFSYHDRDRFIVYGYYLLNIEDENTELIKNGCDFWRNLYQVSAEDAATAIYNDEIDILIDLGGYTVYSRPDILALQPAPIQMQFLGYPNTMGGDFMQYMLADKWLIPESLAPYYTEEILYLPNAYFSAPLEKSDRKFTKADFGFDPDTFIFCCFNRHDKIEPEVFAVWANILREVPNSILWLSDSLEEVKQNFYHAAKQHNIEPQRIVFAEKQEEADYIARYQVTDLFLDTFLYNAGSTGVSALWGGVPLLTLAGNTNSSRIGASLCAAVGLENTICNSKIEYQQKAIHLAKNHQELAAIREQLNTNKTPKPLFSLPQFVRELEKVLLKIIE